jgi:SAM-dependent methyltransferase
LPVVLKERAAAGIHAEVCRVIVEQFPVSATILDLGAGRGAFVDRLRRLGFQHLLAAEIDTAQYGADVPVRRVDLNSQFSTVVADRFDLVTAIEVIEHLENPTQFLRECAAMLNPGGSVLLTTPNIEALPGRLKSLVCGTLRMFDAKGDPTHITPIHTALLSRLAESAGLEVSLRMPLLKYWPSSRAAVRLLSFALAPLVKGAVYGDCHLILLRQRSAESACAPGAQSLATCEDRQVCGERSRHRRLMRASR